MPFFPVDTSLSTCKKNNVNNNHIWYKIVIHGFKIASQTDNYLIIL